MKIAKKAPNMFILLRVDQFTAGGQELRDN